MTQRVDAVVVGLGLVGSAALRHLAGSGLRCAGVGSAEPADLGHHRGPFASHYDSGRITRHLDPVREWAVLAARSIQGYPELERASGVRFHHPSGAVMAELDPVRADAIAEVATGLGLAHEELPAGRVADRRLALPEGSRVLVEGPPAGHVDPRRMLRANVALATARGAEVVRGVAGAVEPAGTGWRVRTTGGRTLGAERVLVATGPHTDELGGLGPLPPMLVRAEAVVLAELDADEAQRLAGLPAVLARLRHPTFADLYLVPPTTYPDGSTRLKLGATRHEPELLVDAAARRGWMAGDRHEHDLAALRSLLEQLVPGLRARSWATRPCLITATGTGLPHVDHLAAGLVVAAGGNGYAAKSANAIGALAAQLLREGRWADPELDRRRFALPAPGAVGRGEPPAPEPHSGPAAAP